MAKELLKGNVAVAEAALRGGCDFFAGYPITPSTETLEYLSHRMPELGMETRLYSLKMRSLPLIWSWALPLQVLVLLQRLPAPASA